MKCFQVNCTTAKEAPQIEFMQILSSTALSAIIIIIVPDYRSFMQASNRNGIF